MWWHEFLPSATIFSIGSISVRWYGLILVAAMIMAGLYARRQFLRRQILNEKQIEDLAFYLIIFSLIGARVGHVLYTWWYYQQHWLDIFMVWQGGLSIQGALLFGILTVWWWTKKHGQKFLAISDILAPAVILGQAIGRWGNYFNQELYGRPTDAWWGIPIDFPNRIPGYENFEYFQPVFFYESMLNLILFFVLHKVLTKKRTAAGFLTWGYLAGYSLVRFVLEFIRIDQALLLGNLRLPQLFSLLIFMGAAIIIVMKYLIKKQPKMA